MGVLKYISQHHLISPGPKECITPAKQLQLPQTLPASYPETPVTLKRQLHLDILHLQCPGSTKLPPRPRGPVEGGKANRGRGGRREPVIDAAS